MKSDLLLHHCCAPCSMQVIGRLRAKFSVSGFWFNPNIHPIEELAKRKDSLLKLAFNSEEQLYEGREYSQALWIENAAKLGGNRCEFCYSLRLRETAKKARSLGIKYFSSTLLASPYQKHDLVRSKALEAALSEGVEFYYEDLRPYFYEGKNEARSMGLYMQKYCGCIFSKEERENRTKSASQNKDAAIPANKGF